MANPIFQMLMRNKAQNTLFNQNPVEILAKQGINIPKENQESSQSMVRYLLDNGTMDRNAFNQVMCNLQRMGFKF